MMVALVPVAMQQVTGVLEIYMLSAEVVDQMSLVACCCQYPEDIYTHIKKRILI